MSVEPLMAPVSVEPLLVPVPAACTMLGISRSRLYEHLAAGRLIARKDGAKTLIEVASIRSHVASLGTLHAHAA